jgi:regulator of protease activity HflC (stomatin/prohibitin superfamily)
MSHENVIKVGNGWLWLTLDLAAYLLAIALLIAAIRSKELALLAVSLPLLVAAIFVSCGFFIVNPNEARVLQLFGRYKGSVKDEGFLWANPFLTKTTVSLRLHNFETGGQPRREAQPLVSFGSLRLSQQDGAGAPTDGGSSGTRRPSKVNDKDGNPVEIAAVVSWRVVDTYDATFTVDRYVEYVQTQSEASLRNLASHFPYDSADEGVQSLRGDTEAVATKLKLELQARLAKAGVEITEARISHLAYAPEIASAMLQRQQASAIIAARQKIVEGAVGMVEDALNKLAAKEIVHLDDERRAAMVSNLLVVLCSQQSAQPVVNAGTLY